MGKTHRFSPEDHDFGHQNHRIRRKDLAQAKREMAVPILSSLAPVIILPVEAPRAFDDGYVPDRAASEASMEQEYIRGYRLDLIHELGEQMLQDDV